MRTRSALVSFLVAVAATLALAAPPAAASSGHGGGGEDGQGFTVSGDTATFPLRAGRTLDGRRFSFIVVEASDSHAADAFGVRVVNKLQNAAGSAVVEHGRLDHGVLVTEGLVDFTPTREVVGDP